MRKLHESENHISITAWLNENLEDKKSIKGCCQEVKKVPKTKGIYFWFMKSDGYKVLSKYITINPIEPRYTKKIDGVQYDLVYLGTAGVRNNANGLNSGHLHERLKWHLCDNKSVSALCSGIMSTYRRTIGGLISDDLIANFIQDEIDLFLCKNFYIYYLEYPGSFLEVKDDVNSDEGILINVIRPIFNLDKNPNAVNQNHVTYLIQQRRQLVENSSKNRWCNSENTRIKSYKVNKSIDTPKATAILNNNISCVEFIVSRTENIAKVAASIPNLPTGICTIELYSNNRNDIRVFVNGKTRKIIINNRTVSEYFNANDTKNGNIPKWIIVSNEMNQVNGIIEEITVKVCSVGDDNLDQTKNNASPKNPLIAKEDKKKKKGAKIIKTKDNEIANKKIEECLENLDWDKLKDKNKPKLLIIGCCNAKQIQPNNIENINPINYNFGNEIEYARTARLNGYIELLNNPQNANYFNKKRDGVVVGTDYFQNALNGELIQAIDLYGSNGSPFYNPVMKRLYKDKIENNNLHLLIVSGLYGIIKHNDFINDYNLTIEKMPFWTKENNTSINDAVKNYIKENHIDNESVFYSLSISGDYSYKNALKPIENWQQIWITGDGDANSIANLRYSANCVKQFLLRL